MDSILDLHTIPPLVLLGIILSGIGTYFVWKAVYNRYFHPLSGFPGPVLGSITDFYLVYIIASVPTFGLELHKKYGMESLSQNVAMIGLQLISTGPVVRLAPNLLSFSDATLLPVVYHRNADKPVFYGSWMFGNTAAMFQSLPHDAHAAKKKLVAPCVELKSYPCSFICKI